MIRFLFFLDKINYLFKEFVFLFEVSTITTTTTPTTITTVSTTTTTIPLISKHDNFILMLLCYFYFLVNQTLIVTENTRINITCSPPLSTINIVYAYYGTHNCTICNCTRMDFTANVTLYCANNGNPSFCTFQAGNSFFGDTCTLVVKKFWLTYFCN